MNFRLIKPEVRCLDGDSLNSLQSTYKLPKTVTKSLPELLN